MYVCMYVIFILDLLLGVKGRSWYVEKAIRQLQVRTMSKRSITVGITPPA